MELAEIGDALPFTRNHFEGLQKSFARQKNGTLDVLLIVRGCKIKCMKWDSNHLVRLKAVGASNIR